MKKRIKVLFDATILNNFYSKDSGRTGIFWTSFRLLDAMSKREDLDIYLYSPNMVETMKFVDDFADKIPHLKICSGDIKKMDVHFSPVFKTADKIRKTGIPCFYILHDCIPNVCPEYFNDGIGWFYDFAKSLTEKDYGFSNSDYTTKDFLQYYPKIDAKKIVTIPLSTNQEYKPKVKLTESVRKKYHIPADKKYLFSLCSLEPRKNLIRSVRTFIKFIQKNKIDDLVFVLGGGAWNGFIEKFEKEVPEYAEYKNKIIRAGYVDDEDMNALYSNAEWFVYTSQYEGFGMPPLEAMSCGCPVITSNNSSLPEVVGDAGIMIDYDSDEQHIEAYEKYYFDEKLRKKMAEKGLKRSKLFSWDKAAAIMAECFKKCKQPKKRSSLNINDFLWEYVQVKAFNFIPLFKIYETAGKKRFLLFNFLPFVSCKIKPTKEIWRIFGIPFFKIRYKSAVTTKYYLLGMPLFKVTRK